MTASLSHAHQHVYDAIMRHPSAHNVQWHDVRSMLGELAHVVQETDGTTTVRRNGRMLVLTADRHKDVSTDEQMRELRTFLKDSDEGLTPGVVSGVNLLVVLDHREARVFRMDTEDMPAQRVLPHDPRGTGRHLHSVTNDANGQRLPELESYYEHISNALRGADQILIFGSATGAASAMVQLSEHLRERAPALATRVVGAITIDETHSTDGQLLAKARQFYADLGAPEAHVASTASQTA